MPFFGNATKEQLIEWGKRGGLTSKTRGERNKKIYYENPKRCKHCSGIIPYEKKTNTFCSQHCSAIFNNLISKHPNGYKCEYETVGYEKPCEYCGKTVKRNRKIKSGVRVFCSASCCSFYYTEQKLKNNQHVKESTLRRYLIHKRGHKCEGKDCGLSTWMGKPVPLDLHHKDGDATNNAPENLELLCKNCHGQTDNYGAKNIGRGTRKNYYKKQTNN